MPRKRTSYKKEILVVPKEGTGLLKIKFKGGGELPKQLQGTFTSDRDAQQTITNYKRNKGIK